MEVHVKAADTTAETLAALQEEVTALNKNISSIQGDVNRWQEQQFADEEEEMYDAEDSFPTSRSTTVIDLMTDSTSKLRELRQSMRMKRPQFCPHHQLHQILPQNDFTLN